MTQDEWTTSFAAWLVELGNLTEHEAALRAIDFAGGEEAYGKPEACADNLIGLWDDEGEPA